MELKRCVLLPASDLGMTNEEKADLGLLVLLCPHAGMCGFLFGCSGWIMPFLAVGTCVPAAIF